MKSIKFHKAYDALGRIVDISKVEVSNREEVFTCIGCKQRIYPRLGNVRSHHFYHKEGECCSESYLHFLAKKMIMNHFKSGKPLLMKIPACYTCSETKTCKYYSPEHCTRNFTFDDSILQEYNLCDFYDDCFEEKGVGEFVGDIVLRDSKTGRTLMIEIFYKHPCEPKKWNSNNKIIETLPIKNESQIEDLLENGFSPSNCRFSKSFKIPTIVKKLKSGHMSRFMYFAKSGKAHIPSPFPTGDLECDTQFSIDCEQLSVKKNKYATTELNVIGDYLGNPTSYQLGLLYMHIHYGVEHCSICKYYRSEDQVCNLYRKYHTPLCPQGPEARECRYFRVMIFDQTTIESSVEEVK